ncbi:MAG: hypothetical protein AAGI53_13280 [Planctomycetota bacterium]
MARPSLADVIAIAICAVCVLSGCRDSGEGISRELSSEVLAMVKNSESEGTLSCKALESQLLAAGFESSTITVNGQEHSGFRRDRTVDGRNYMEFTTFIQEFGSLSIEVGVFGAAPDPVIVYRGMCVSG